MNINSLSKAPNSTDFSFHPVILPIQQAMITTIFSQYEQKYCIKFTTEAKQKYTRELELIKDPFIDELRKKLNNKMDELFKLHSKKTESNFFSRMASALSKFFGRKPTITEKKPAITRPHRLTASQVFERLRKERILRENALDDILLHPDLSVDNCAVTPLSPTLSRDLLSSEVESPEEDSSSELNKNENDLSDPCFYGLGYRESSENFENRIEPSRKKSLFLRLFPKSEKPVLEKFTTAF